MLDESRRMTPPFAPSRRQALEAELSGDFKAAMDIYTDLLRRFENRFEDEEPEESESIRRSRSISGGDGTTPATEEPGASVAELSAWDMRRLECMRQLGQWKVGLLVLPAD